MLCLCVIWVVDEVTLIRLVVPLLVCCYRFLIRLYVLCPGGQKHSGSL